MLVFVDESQRPGRYAFAAAFVDEHDAPGLRRTLRRLCFAGQRRIHFSNEQDPRRRHLLAQFKLLPTEAHHLTCRLGRGARVTNVRAALLTRLFEDHHAAMDHLVIESCDPAIDRLDSAAIERLRGKGLVSEDLTWEHLPPHTEPLLWLADAAAWSMGGKREWQQRCRGFVASTTDLGVITP